MVPGLGLLRGGGQGLQLSLVFDGLHVFPWSEGPFPLAITLIPEMMSADSSVPIWIIFRNFVVMTNSPWQGADLMDLSNVRTLGAYLTSIGT